MEKLIRIDSESQPVYVPDKYIKTKVKIYVASMITIFHNKKKPKEKVPCKCLSIIMLDSVIKANKKYYPQTFLKECKYIQEKVKTENYNDEELDNDSNDEAESDIHNDNDNVNVNDNHKYEKTFIESILIQRRTNSVC